MSFQDSTINEVVSLLKRGFYEYEIKKVLTQNKIEEKGHKTVIEIAKRIIKNEKRKSRRIKSLLLAVIFFAIFAFMIPLDIYTLLPSLISIVGSITISVFIFQSRLNFDSWGDFQGSSKRIGWYTIPFIILVLFISTILLTFFERRQNQQLVNDGIRTTATVTKYAKFGMRKSKNELVYIRHKIFTGKTINKSFYVLEKYRPGEIVMIEYSRRNPNIVKIIREENID